MHEPTIQEVLANAEVLTGPPVTAWRVPARLVPVGAAVWTHGAFREVLSNEETDTITSRRALQLAGAPGTELPGECGMVKGPNDVVLVEAEPAPVRVPEDGAEGAEWTVVQRELGWYVPGPGHPRGFGPGSRRDGPVCGAVSPHDGSTCILSPGHEPYGHDSGRPGSRLWTPAPAPVSEEPEGGDLMANLERSLERARAAKKARASEPKAEEGKRDA